MSNQKPSRTKDKRQRRLSPAPCSASPTPLEFEVCRQVLRWLRDKSGLDHSWFEPLTEISGVVRGCKVIAEQQKEESAREAWIESLAKTCQVDDKPCDGCQQGGVCDGSPNDRTERRRAGGVEMQTESDNRRSLQ